MLKKNYHLLLALILWSLAGWASAGNPLNYHLVVAKNGSGQYTTIQSAIDAAKAFPHKPIVIDIKNGVYKEKVNVFSWNTHIVFRGESVDKTIITFDSHFKDVNRGRNSTFLTATLEINGNDFHGENFTVINTAGPVGQALAVSVNADRVSFKNVRFLGHQDTLYVAGENHRVHFSQCYIEGTTDFIFGGATAVFENCQIHSKANSYITAASTLQNQPFGFVFFNCTLTAEPGITKVYLGRPWRPYAKVAFIGTTLGKHIHPEGWSDWNNATPTTAQYSEYANTGPGASTKQRVSWSLKLSDSQVKEYTVENILIRSGEARWY